MRVRLILISLLALAATAFAQQPNHAPANSTSTRKGSSIDVSTAEVLAFEQDMEAAVVRGDVEHLSRILAPDFTFTHGDGWTTGGAPIRVDTRASWLEAVGKQPYLSRDLDSVKVEMHGDIAITYGRYVAKNRGAAAGRDRFTVWFERVYARRNGQWQYVSHRTVHGPTYE
jgi:hypothetical protein